MSDYWHQVVAGNVEERGHKDGNGTEARFSIVCDFAFGENGEIFVGKWLDGGDLREIDVDHNTKTLDYALPNFHYVGGDFKNNISFCQDKYGDFIFTVYGHLWVLAPSLSLAFHGLWEQNTPGSKPRPAALPFRELVWSFVSKTPFGDLLAVQCGDTILLVKDRVSDRKWTRLFSDFCGSPIKRAWMDKNGTVFALRGDEICEIRNGVVTHKIKTQMQNICITDEGRIFGIWCGNLVERTKAEITYKTVVADDSANSLKNCVLKSSHYALYYTFGHQIRKIELVPRYWEMKSHATFPKNTRAIVKTIYTMILRGEEEPLHKCCPLVRLPNELVYHILTFLQ